MLPLDIFFTRLMPLVPGCPEPAAAACLLDAATEFSDRTRAVRVTTEPQPLEAGVSGYLLELPQDTEVVQVLRAWVNTRPLILPPEAHRMTVASAGRPLGAPTLGTPVAMLPGEDGEFTLYPAPDTGGYVVTARVALRPVPTATQVMDVLFTRWRDAIVGGAAARLAAQPGKAYTDPLVAARGEATFAHGLSQARVEANRDLMPGDIAVRGRPLA